VHQPRRDRRQRRASAHAARNHGRPVKRSLALVGVAVLALFALEFSFLHWMQSLDNRLLDSMIRSHAAELAPDPDIVLVNIDEKSLADLDEVAGRFPWPRVVYGQLLDGLAPQHPRAIVFDILFAEPDIVRPESDQEFVAAAQRHSDVNVFYPMVRLESKTGMRASQLAPLINLVPGPGANPDARIAVVPPLILPQKLWRTGTINFLADDDGIGRRYELRTRVEGWNLPSLPARVAVDLGFPLPDADTLV